MDKERLNRLQQELEKARKKRDDWDGRVKELERKYREAENTFIHDMVHAASLTPEQLAELIKRASVSLPRTEEAGEQGRITEQEPVPLSRMEESMKGAPDEKEIPEMAEFPSSEERIENKEPGASADVPGKAEPEDPARVGWMARFSERRTNEKK